MNVSRWSLPGKEARQCGGKAVERVAYLHGVQISGAFSEKVMAGLWPAHL